MRLLLNKKNNLGFSVLEMLVAMTILVLTISAVILVSFGNQSVLADNQTNSEALNKAQALLEKAQADSRKDFRLVNPSTASEDIYQKTVTISQPDYFTKLVTATISWSGENNRTLNNTLSTLVTNFNNPIGGDTCYSWNMGNWQTPQKVGNQDYNFASDLVGDSNVYPITSLDAYKGKLYVTVNNQSANNNTFFVFDISNQNQKPVLRGSLDNSTVNAGLNAVAVAEDVASGKIYAYVASARAISAAADFGQFQVIEVTNASNPVLVATYKINGITGTSGQGIGSSIFYKDGYVYLGLTTGGGPELHIIDVHHPLAPVEISGGNFTVGNTINQIYVRNKYAYLVSPNSQELKILDISSPGSPILVGGYDAVGGSGNGKSVYTVGDRIYLGRTVGATEFFILDNSTPAIVQLPLLGSKADVDNSVNGLIIRDNLVFLLTNNDLQILKIDDPLNITPYTSVSLTSANQGQALDCEGNYLYSAYLNSSSQGFVTVVTAP